MIVFWLANKKLFCILWSEKKNHKFTSTYLEQIQKESASRRKWARTRRVLHTLNSINSDIQCNSRVSRQPNKYGRRHLAYKTFLCNHVSIRMGLGLTAYFEGNHLNPSCKINDIQPFSSVFGHLLVLID